MRSRGDAHAHTSCWFDPQRGDMFSLLVSWIACKAVQLQRDVFQSLSAVLAIVRLAVEELRL